MLLDNNDKNFIEVLVFIFKHSTKIKKLSETFMPASQLLMYHTLYLASTEGSEYTAPLYALYQKVQEEIKRRDSSECTERN
jgi:predicted membrane GTPase involved in stress response